MNEIEFNPEQLKREELIQDYINHEKYIVLIHKNGKITYYIKNNEEYEEIILPNDYIISEVIDNEYIIIKDNNTSKKGYFNLKTKKLCSPIYDKCRAFNKEVAPVCINGKWGVINTHNEIIIPIEYDSCSCNDDITIVSKNYQYAYFNKEGKQLMDFTHEELNPFESGLTEYMNQIVDINLTPLFYSTKIYYSDYKNKIFIYREGNNELKYYKNGRKKIISREINLANLRTSVVKNNHTFYFFYNNAYLMIINSEGELLGSSEQNLVLPYTKDDPIWYRYIERNRYCYKLFQGTYTYGANSYNEITRFYKGYSYAKKEREPYILLDKNGNIKSRTNYEKFLGKEDDLYIFYTDHSTYIIVDYLNNKIAEFTRDKAPKFVEYKGQKYDLYDASRGDSPWWNLSLVIQNENKIIDKQIKVIINNKNNPLIENIFMDHITVNKMDMSYLTEEEKLRYEIKLFLKKFNNENLNKKFNSIIDKYKIESTKIIENDKKKRKKFDEYHENGNESYIPILTLNLSQEDSKTYYNQYIKQLQTFLEKLQAIKPIFDKINEIKDLINDKNIECTDDLMKDIKVLVELYPKLNDKLRQKNIDLFNNALEEEKNTLVNNFLEEKSDSIYENLEKWERNFRLTLQSMIIQYQEDYQLSLIDKKLQIIKDSSNEIEKSYYDVILLYVDSINRLISHIELINEDEKIKKELEKFKNIKIDMNKSIKENIDDIISTLEYVIKLDVRAEYLNEPDSYKSSERI